MRILTGITIILLLHFNGAAQGFQFSGRNNPAPVVRGMSGDTLKYAFLGGLNSCQFGQIDLDLDGRDDLLVFDRHGNRTLTFINQGYTGAIGFVPDQTYASRLPSFREWVQCMDYNRDGKKDIFTYTTGGIRVYQNTSTEYLSFKPVSEPYLVSLQGPSRTNILVTYADYPAITDVDNDGDYDILSFWGLGSFIDWHKNMSEEYYGNADSLVFEKVTGCWGQFAESGESNRISLDTCHSSGIPAVNLKSAKHTGSTLLAGDFNSDGLPDLVIGDVDFPGVKYLQNGGSAGEAKMISQTGQFPSAGDSVNLPSFPAISLLDVNNDGLNDLLVSPFDPSLVRAEPSAGNWLYLNAGGPPGVPEAYLLYQRDFLQKDMIDLGAGAYPLLFDVDGDGLADLLAGNFGRLDSSSYSPGTGLQCFYRASLAYFRNTGNHQTAEFTLTNPDFLGLSSLEMQSLIPAAGDLDGDGDMDLLCGNSKGKFIWLRNSAATGAAPDFVLEDPAFRDLDAGDFSAPQIIDLNGDGLQDIISGRRDGRLTYFRNTGPANDPHFEQVTDFLGGVDVTQTDLSYFGYSVPFITRTGNRLKILAGSEFGDIFVFTVPEEDPEGNFLPEGKLDIPYPGLRSSMAIGQLDTDTLFEVFIGNYSGGLNFYEMKDPTAAGIHDHPKTCVKKVLLFPNPANHQLKIDIEDGKEDTYSISIYSFDGRLVFKESSVKLPLEVDVSRIQNGIYSVSLLNSSGRIMEKLVVSH